MREICLPPLFPKLSAKSTGGGGGRDKRQRDGWESCLLACSWLGRGGGGGGGGAGEGRRGGDVWARPLRVLSRDKQVVTGTSLQPLWGVLALAHIHPRARTDRPTLFSPTLLVPCPFCSSLPLRLQPSTSPEDRSHYHAHCQRLSYRYRSRNN